MKTFRFELASLLDLRRHRRDVCLRTLHDALLAAHRVAARRRQLELKRNAELALLRQRNRSAAFDHAGSARRRAYARQVSHDIARVDAELACAERHVAQARADLQSAEQAVNSLERLASRRREEHRLSEQRQAAVEWHEQVLCRVQAGAASA